jgi:5-methyltetrahydrofolate--homocysteine methyltransferase
MADLRQRLSEPGIIILDGATGTQLQQMGLPAGKAPELWNLENPEAVKKHYRAYLEAGSDAILTNSFGGTRPRLEMEGSGDLTHEINVAAAKLAREVAGPDRLVLGSMGPTGVLMEPMGELTYDKAVGYFAEQAAALAEGGADGIHIETMSDLQEAKAAIEGAHQATDLPVTVTMSFDMHGRTMMGVRPEDAVKELWAMDVLAVGVNCGRTLEENLKALTEMRTAAPEVTLIAKPNAGLPRMEDGVEAVYDVTPEIMADYALKFGAQHVKMLGGCCGSNPSHITALKETLKDFEAPPLAEVLAANKAAAEAEGADNDRRSRRRGGSRRKG